MCRKAHFIVEDTFISVSDFLFLLERFIEKSTCFCKCFFLEAPPRFELGNKGVADLCLTTWPWRLTYILSIRILKIIFRILIFWQIKRRNVRLLIVERKTRFELATFTLARWRSTTEPLPHKKCNCGASGRNRTTDTGIFSPLLYRLSYRSKTFGDLEGTRTLDL